MTLSHLQLAARIRKFYDIVIFAALVVMIYYGFDPMLNRIAHIIDQLR